MAKKDRQGFVLYNEDMRLLRCLADEDVLQVIWALQAYSDDLNAGKEPSAPTLSRNAMLFFEVMSEKVLRDHQAYVDKCEKNSAIRRAAVHVDERQQMSANVDERQRTSTNVDERQRTSTNQTVTETETETELELELEPEPEPERSGSGTDSARARGKTAVAAAAPRVKAPAAAGRTAPARNGAGIAAMTAAQPAMNHAACSAETETVGSKTSSASSISVTTGSVLRGREDTARPIHAAASTPPAACGAETETVGSKTGSASSISVTTGSVIRGREDTARPIARPSKASSSAAAATRSIDAHSPQTMPTGSIAAPTPPTREAVAAYAAGAGLTIDAARFCDYYATRGWTVNGTPMQDWRAAVRTWVSRDKPAHTAPRGKVVGEQQYTQRPYTHTEDAADELVMGTN